MKRHIWGIGERSVRWRRRRRNGRRRGSIICRGITPWRLERDRERWTQNNTTLLDWRERQHTLTTDRQMAVVNLRSPSWSMIPQWFTPQKVRALSHGPYRCSIPPFVCPKGDTTWWMVGHTLVVGSSLLQTSFADASKMSALFVQQCSLYQRAHQHQNGPVVQ